MKLMQDDGFDCIVITAWDGVTYFNDGKGDMVRFNYGDNIIAFVCGKTTLMLQYRLNILNAILVIRRFIFILT